MLELKYHDRLGAIGIPTSVVCGELDKTCPPWQSEHLAASIPGARMRWLSGVAHMVNYEAPDVIVDEVMKLSTVPERSRARHTTPAN